MPPKYLFSNKVRQSYCVPSGEKKKSSGRLLTSGIDVIRESLWGDHEVPSFVTLKGKRVRPPTASISHEIP